MAIGVIILFLVALGYPYWWAAILRWRMVRRLGRVSRECGFRLRPLRKPLLFIRNRGQHYDFLIENKERIFAIKLWSAYRADSFLVITEHLRVFQRKYAPVPLDVRRNAKAAKSEGRARPVPRTKLSLSLKETRSLTRVFLVYPSYRAILRQERTGERRLMSGDSVFDKILYSPSALEGVLRDCDPSKKEKTEEESQRVGSTENFKQI